jgi:acyl-CoA dehydrogenase family member 9
MNEVADRTKTAAATATSAAVATDTLRRDESAAKNLFFGEILEENLFPYPKMSARDAELLGAMVDSIDGFLDAHTKEFKHWDRDAHQPAEFIQGLRDMGLFGLIIPEEFGGLALSNAGYARVLQQTSRHDSSVSLTVGAHSSIGMKGILLWANDEQKLRYLPKLASGEMIAAFCLTESGAGSDAASIKTTAKKNSDGSWTLSGEKIWITNGGIAQVFTVFARTDEGEGKMTAFIVEAGWKGVSHGPHEDKMGIRASSTTTVAFVDVIVPPENVLGPEGKGFKVAMSILNNGRTGLGGGAVGGMKTLIKLASAQAQDRKQFGRPIAEFGLIREKIAQMTLDCFAAESVVWMVAHYIDSGVEDYSVEAAISKVFASDAIQRCAHEALQIAAGNGFMREFPYEQITRDCRILSIFEGTNEILRLYIALSGLKDVGSSLGELKAAVGDIFNNPIKGFGILSGYAEKRFKEATGFGADKILSNLHPRLKAGSEIYAKYTLELSKAGDALLRMHGKAIADFQHQQKRIADVAIDLFVGLCVHSRADTIAKAEPAKAEATLVLAEVFAQQAKRRMARNIRALLSNEDTQLDAIAAATLKSGEYVWDVI